MDTTIYKGERFKKESTIDVRTHYKPTETFQYTNLYNSCHPSGVEKGFVKVEALRILRTNSSRVTLRKNIKNFRARLHDLERLSLYIVWWTTSSQKFTSQIEKKALTQKQKAHKKILPFVTQFQPSLPCLKTF